MQIRRLKIDNHKCLVDFEINFATQNDGSTTILIGENGSGKSTMIETVLTIFMSFDSPKIEKEIDYNYFVEYEYAQEIYEITQINHKYKINCNGFCSFEGNYKDIKAFVQQKNIFPQRIIAFYSGTNNKIKNQINRVNGNYASNCRQIIQSYYTKNNFENNQLKKRKYNYCREDLTPVYLAAIMGGQPSYEKDYLTKQCFISSIDSILVSVNVPFAARIVGSQEIYKFENETISKIIDFIDNRMTSAFKSGYMDATHKQAFFVLNNVDFQGMDSVAIYNFFEKLQTLLNGQFETYVIIGGEKIKSSDLSEGQRQLIKMLGMLGVCKSEDSLVLLDEPDAHMNPKWKYDIKSTIDDCLKESLNTQAIIATHDPLVVNGVKKEQIRIFERDTNGHTKVIEPMEDTVGLGIDGLLQSEYYGLRTSYDKESDNDFKLRQQLYIKLLHDEATADEKNKLMEITRKIGSFRVSNNTLDFLYDDFISIYRNSKYYLDDYLSPEEIKERRKTIERIISDLFSKKEGK